MKTEFVIASASCVAVFLHGCGGGSTTSAPSTTPNSTATTTSTPSGPPTDGKELAEFMNSEFNGYQPGDNSTPFGNWVRWSVNLEPDHVGLYCGDDCYDGKPDCKISGSILNSKQMLTSKSGASAAWAEGSPNGWYMSDKGTPFTGYYISSQLVQDRLGKCLYAWDGATDQKKNMGCGPPAEVTMSDKCADPASAYKNMAPPDYTKPVDPQSDYVLNQWCGRADTLPADGVGASCFWKGPAFDENVPSPDETHTMLDQRVAHQEGSGAGGPAITTYNEYILDGKLLFEELEKNAAGTILAVMYSKSRDGDDSKSKDNAQQQSKLLQAKFKLEKPLPVMFLDQSFDARDGKGKPWVFNEEDQPTSDVTV